MIWISCSPSVALCVLNLLKRKWYSIAVHILHIFPSAMSSIFSSAIAQRRFLGFCGRVTGAGLINDARLIATTSCWLTAPPPPLARPSRSKADKRNKNNDPVLIDTSAVNLCNRKEAQLWVDRLALDERENLARALQFKIQPGSAATALPSKDNEPLQTGEAKAQLNRVPDMKELCHLAFHQAIPFVGFGFLDNFIMILAGDYIDHNIGVTLGITTMAAAALGNTLSDLFGIGSAWYVESFAARLGAKPPDLTRAQLQMTRSKVAANLGRALGVVLGCIIGMIPLIFT